MSVLSSQLRMNFVIVQVLKIAKATRVASHGGKQ